MTEKRYFRNSLQKSIENCTGRKAQCCCFGKFYKEEAPPRCLLDEYRDEEGKLFFDEREALQICPYRNIRVKTGCEYPGNPQTKNRRVQELTYENGILKEENWKLRTELKEVVSELKSLSTV